jgi:hypothetical protein
LYGKLSKSPCLLRVEWWFVKFERYAGIVLTSSHCVAVQRKKKGSAAPMQAAVPPPARYFETISVVEQLPLSQAGHVELQRSIKQ